MQTISTTVIFIPSFRSLVSWSPPVFVIAEKEVMFLLLFPLWITMKTFLWAPFWRNCTSKRQSPQLLCYNTGWYAKKIGFFHRIFSILQLPSSSVLSCHQSLERPANRKTAHFHYFVDLLQQAQQFFLYTHPVHFWDITWMSWWTIWLEKETDIVTWCMHTHTHTHNKEC